MSKPIVHFRIDFYNCKINLWLTYLNYQLEHLKNYYYSCYLCSSFENYYQNYFVILSSCLIKKYQNFKINKNYFNHSKSFLNFFLN